MNEKVIILDMDGVVVKKVKVFSIRFSERNNIPLDEVVNFFKNEFELCLVGKADLKEEIKKYFNRWNYKGGIDELLKFWFESEADIDLDLTKKITSLRNNGTKVYLATNNEKYRVSYLWNNVGLKNYFDGIFSSAEIGLKKPDPDFYLSVLNSLKVKAHEVLFFDDSMENVKAAKDLGINARYYSGISDFKVV